MQKQILLMQKNRFDYFEIQTGKSIQIWRLGLEKKFHQAFYGETVNNFLNSEHKIIYTEQRVNNFVMNAEHKKFYAKCWKYFMQKTVNNFYEKTVNNST